MLFLPGVWAGDKQATSEHLFLFLSIGDTLPPSLGNLVAAFFLLFAGTNLFFCYRHSIFFHTLSSGCQQTRHREGCSPAGAAGSGRICRGPPQKLLRFSRPAPAPYFQPRP